MTVWSRPGRGSTFTIRLPRVPDQDPGTHEGPTGTGTVTGADEAPASAPGGRADADRAPGAQADAAPDAETDGTGAGPRRTAQTDQGEHVQHRSAR